jgi:hypothetical protein
MIADDAFWNSQALWAGVFALIVGASFASSAVTSRRLSNWAREEKVRVLKKQRAIIDGAPPWFHRKATGCYYLTVEDEERHIFRGWIRVGGIFAAICNRKPIVVWDGLPDYVKR